MKLFERIFGKKQVEEKASEIEPKETEQEEVIEKNTVTDEPEEAKKDDI